MNYKQWEEDRARELEVAIADHAREQEEFEILKKEALLEYVKAQFAAYNHRKNQPLMVQWREVMNDYIEQNKAREAVEKDIMLQEALAYIKSQKPKRVRKK